MGQAFSFEHRVEFHPERADELLRSVPAAPGVFVLRGESEQAEPYLARAADLRRRLRRLLLPPESIVPGAGLPSARDPTLSLPEAEPEQGEAQVAAWPAAQPVFTRRLNLRARIRFLEWTQTGSEFESTLLLYQATRAAFGAERARERLKLYPPFVVRLTIEHMHPRLYVTNRLSRKSLPESFGPFPSRLAAERYADAVNDLFKLRRCHENLVVHPDHPGCAYGEMKRCLAPCKAAVTAREYADEAGRVHAFLCTRGESLLEEIARERDTASDAMEFEAASTLHARWEKVKAAAHLADELVRPLPELRAVVVQEAAPRIGEDEPHNTHESPVSKQARSEDATVFLLQSGQLTGPERLSTLGVRAVREQTAVGSSLFAQPLMLAAVPEPAEGALPMSDVSVQSPEHRARVLLDDLQAQGLGEPDMAAYADTLALFKRWYYRPEKQRAGDVFLPNADGSWPIRRLLNGAARVVLGPPAEMSPVLRKQAREAAKDVTKAMETGVLHAGREGVEPVIPVLPERSRARKAVLPSDVVG